MISFVVEENMIRLPFVDQMFFVKHCTQ